MKKTCTKILLTACFIALLGSAVSFAQDTAPNSDAVITEENLSPDVLDRTTNNMAPPPATEIEMPVLTPVPPPKMVDMDMVVLRTIDKLSTRTHTFDIPVNKTVKFGNSLYIKARSCRKSSPIDRPESAAFLQIWERKPREDKSQWIFSGWMFASSPSLSAMDHPVYDVWVIDCKNKSTSEKSEKFSSESTPEHSPEEETESPTASEGNVPDAGNSEE